MLYSTITVLAVVLTVQAAATFVPAPAVKGRAAFPRSVSAIRNENFNLNATDAVLSVYAKYNLTPTKKSPAAFVSELRKRQQGSTKASVMSDGIQYLITASIGGQDMKLTIDSGSSDLWVFSSHMDASSQVGHHVYDPSSSPTYQAMDGYTWKGDYLDGSYASGVVGTDTVVIGGTTVTGQAIQLAEEISLSFSCMRADGILGLGFSEFNSAQPQKQSTFIENARNSLDAPVVAAYLPYMRHGAFDFGHINPDRYNGTIKYGAIDKSQGLWVARSDSYQIGGNRTFPSHSRYSLFDTTNNVLVFPREPVENYYRFVDGAYYDITHGLWVMPCRSLSDAPSFSFQIGESMATISSRHMVYSYAYANMCFGSLQAHETSHYSVNIIGTPFFNSYYSVFDAGSGEEGPRLGFAPLYEQTETGSKLTPQDCVENHYHYHCHHVPNIGSDEEDEDDD